MERPFNRNALRNFEDRERDYRHGNSSFDITQEISGDKIYRSVESLNGDFVMPRVDLQSSFDMSVGGKTVQKMVSPFQNSRDTLRMVD